MSASTIYAEKTPASGKLLSRESFKVENLSGSLTYVLFMAFLAVIYIGNTHFAEKNVRKINKLDRELKELRWEYMSTHSDLMFKSKQTEVAKQVEPLGLKELRVPPKKIVK